VLAVVLTLPGVLALAAVAILVFAWPSLPAELPVHWGVSGRPDEWAPRGWVVGVMLALAALPPLLSYPRLLRGGPPARSRLLAAAALGMTVILVLGIVLVTVIGAGGGASGNWVWLVVLAMFVVPFLMLYIPLRLGLRAEWRGVGGSDGEGD